MQSLQYRKPFYYKKGDDQPYCARCWDVDRKAVHLVGPTQDSEGNEAFRCPQCKILWLSDGSTFYK